MRSNSESSTLKNPSRPSLNVWRHINTHRLCVSDDSGAETCITKAQLDSFLSKEAHAEISQPAVGEEVKALSPQPVESVAIEAVPSSEPSAVVGEDVLPNQDPETTGTGNSAFSGSAVVSTPEVQIHEDLIGQSDD